MRPSPLFKLAFRPVVSRPLLAPAKTASLSIPLTSRRSSTAAGETTPETETPKKGPNQEQLPHVSEEAAAISEITGEETKPQVEEQGTPVQEVLKRGGDVAKDKAPKVMQEGIGKSGQGSRSYSTTARRRMELQSNEHTIEDIAGIQAMLEQTSKERPSVEVENNGHIYGLPTLPLPRNMHLRRRKDPLVAQFTQLLMRSGNLSRAERIVALILERLRTAPSPRSDSAKPLVPGAPPVSHLPLHPVLYMTLAVDSAAPLLRLQNLKGLSGGGTSVQIPFALTVKQRRRTCIKWILESADKKNSKGSGRAMYANKVADELIAIVEGRSSIWDKRQALHKLAVAGRAYLEQASRARRR